MAKIKVPNSTPEERIRFTIDTIGKMFSYQKTIRLIRDQFGLDYENTMQLMQGAYQTIAAEANRTVKLTKDIYIASLLDFKDRCQLHEDLENERKILHDIGRAMNFITPDNITNINTDPDIEKKKEERLKDLLEKYNLKDKINEC
jgi:hypothetical protein